MKSVLILGGCGYIGSQLFLYLTTKGYEVTTVDLELFGNYVNSKNIKQDYADLSKESLEKYDVIVNLAAHSSVAMANNDIRRTLDNNLVNFFDLLFKVSGKKFIYASSSSVYNGLTQFEADEDSNSYNINNLYDMTKLFTDNATKLYGDQFYGLRFGTVCGHSPNMRVDVMINKMVHTALNHGKIEIYNKNVNRPILGLSDLCDGIYHIIKNDGAPGLYNMASTNDTIIDIGNAVARAMGVPVIDKGESNTYDFRMSSKRFSTTFKFDFKQDIDQIVNDVLDNWNPEQQGTRV
jgi:nucleoside-diphosphate-sugar epimerase